MHAAKVVVGAQPRRVEVQADARDCADEAAEAAEVANLMSARRNSQVAAGLGRNGYSYENRRMSKVSKRSQRSSIGAGSVNGQGPGGPGALTTTTTAEVSHPY